MLVRALTGTGTLLDTGTVQLALTSLPSIVSRERQSTRVFFFLTLMCPSVDKIFESLFCFLAPSFTPPPPPVSLVTSSLAFRPPRTLIMKMMLTSLRFVAVCIVPMQSDDLLNSEVSCGTGSNECQDCIDLCQNDSESYPVSDRLYNLKDDPREEHDLYDQYPEVKAALFRQAWIALSVHCGGIITYGVCILSRRREQFGRWSMLRQSHGGAGCLYDGRLGSIAPQHLMPDASRSPQGSRFRPLQHSLRTFPLQFRFLRVRFGALPFGLTYVPGSTVVVCILTAC